MQIKITEITPYPPECLKIIKTDNTGLDNIVEQEGLFHGWWEWEWCSHSDQRPFLTNRMPAYTAGQF